MPLTDIAVKKAKPAASPYKLTDGAGLYLLVSASGKYWRFNYRFHSRQKTLAFGTYPDVSLARARERHAEARRLLADGIDPSVHRKETKQAALAAMANSF